MTERQKIEREIQEVLTNETQAIPLSNKLFSPDGLFSRLASTEQERRALVKTPLFKQAQHRFLALQHAEAEALAKVVEQAQAAMPEARYRLRLELVETAEVPAPRTRAPRTAMQVESQEGAQPEAPDGSRHS